MRNYWTAFVLIISIGFGGLGMIIFKGFIQQPKPELFYLNVDSMKMAAADIIDFAGQRPSVVSIFPCDKMNMGGEAIPWADLYVCRSSNKSDSLSGDTALVLIDVHTKSGLHDIENVDHYDAGVKMQQKFKKCKVMVPANQIDNIRKRRYKFGTVTLVIDWIDD